MSVEAWLESSVLLLASLLLVLSGLVEASLNRRQRMTIREILENGSTGRNSESGVDYLGDIRAAADSASLLAVLLIGGASAHLVFRQFDVPWAVSGLVVVAGAILFLGRVIPEAVVERFALADSEVVQSIGQGLAVLMTPVVVLIAISDRLFQRNADRVDGDAADSGVGNSARNVTGREDSGERSELQQDEQEMISGILSMDDAFAREIMVPRPDIIAVALDTPLEEVARIAQEAGHSRIPVYEHSIDQVRGIIYAKDLLRFVTEDVNGSVLSDLIRPALYVPESKRVDDLLRDLRRSRVHLAIVVDEYGGTAGLVTIEDIIEEIVGEIQDEYDRERPMYQFESDRQVTVDGRMGVDELAELLDVTIPETESDTVGGFVQRELGHIPEPGEVVEAGPVILRVESVERRRVRTVQVVLDDSSASGAIDTVRAS